MPKFKSNRAAAKRFRLTKNGLIKRARSNKNHILNKKSRKRKRVLRHGAYVAAVEAKTIKAIIPYK